MNGHNMDFYAYVRMSLSCISVFLHISQEAATNSVGKIHGARSGQSWQVMTFAPSSGVS